MNFIKRFFVMRKFRKELEKMREDPVLYYRNRKNMFFASVKKTDRLVGIYCYLKHKATDGGKHGILLSDGSVDYMEVPRISYVVYDPKSILQALGIHYVDLKEFKRIGMPVIHGSRILYTSHSLDWIAENRPELQSKIKRFRNGRK